MMWIYFWGFHLKLVGNIFCSFCLIRNFCGNLKKHFIKNPCIFVTRMHFVILFWCNWVYNSGEKSGQNVSVNVFHQYDSSQETLKVSDFTITCVVGDLVFFIPDHLERFVQRNRCFWFPNVHFLIDASPCWKSSAMQQLMEKSKCILIFQRLCLRLVRTIVETISNLFHLPVFLFSRAPH